MKMDKRLDPPPDSAQCPWTPWQR